MYDTISILKNLAKKNDKKIVLLVMDGLGGLPYKGKTALEAARTKNLDKLAAKNECGLMDPVFPGITPGCQSLDYRTCGKQATFKRHPDAVPGHGHLQQGSVAYQQNIAQCWSKRTVIEAASEAGAGDTAVFPERFILPGKAVRAQYPVGFAPELF